MSIPNHASGVLIGILTAWLTVCAVSYISGPESDLLAFEDDAFFYFRIADNTVEEGVVSYDRLTGTNGFHPLWMWILVLLRTLFTDSFSFLRSVGVLSHLLLFITGVLAILKWKAKYSYTVILVLTVFLLRYMRDFAVMGMETSILLPLVFISLKLLDDLKDNSSLKLLYGLGTALAFMGLSRLDSVFLGATIAAMGLRITGRRGLIPLLLPGVMAATIYFASNFLLHGIWTSVSGMMKASGFGLNQLFFRQLFTLSDPLGWRSPWGLYLVLLLSSFPVIFSKRVPTSARASGIFLVLFTISNLFLSSWRLWYWYTYPAVIFLVFGAPPLLQGLYEKLSLPKNAMKILNYILLASSAILAVYWGLSYPDVLPADFRLRNMHIARELNGVLPDSAVIAMGDRSGSFAYFFRGSVIQAEGLAGDRHLAAAIIQKDLERYLLDSGARYILSWTGPHGVTDYEYWELNIPDMAQCSWFNNTIAVYGENEMMRWTGELETAFLWRIQSE